MRVACALLIACVVAAPAAADVDVQHWHNIFIQGRMTAPSTSSPSTSAPSPALFYLELQPRISLSEIRPDRVLLRGAIGWEIARDPSRGRSLSVWGGVAAIPRFEAPAWHVNETRLWQQVLFTDRLGDLQLMYRGRLEQRAFENDPGPALRTRAMLRAVYTLPVPDRNWALVASDELFVGLLGPDERLGFDQNRAFVGVMHKFAPWFSVEGGYLHVNVGSDRVLPTLLLQTIVNLM